MQKQMTKFIILIFAVCAVGAQGATIDFSAAAPTPGANDISNLSGAAQDRDNVGGDGSVDGTGNDGTTYVAPDQPTQGQTFTTGAGLMSIGGIWIRHPGYSGNNPGGLEADNTWYAMGTNTQITIRVTDPAAAGTAGFVLASETAPITGTEPGVLPATSTNTPDGTGTWIHIELDTPIPVAVNTLYGFDLGGSAGTFFETLGIRDAAAGGNPYALGSAYTSGTGGAGDNTLAAQSGDRVFIVEMVPFVSGASNPDPADNAVDVDSDAAVTFSWNTGLVADPMNPDSTIPNPDIMYHCFYINKNEPNFIAVIPIAVDSDTNPADGNVDPSASYTPASLLDSDSQYFWRVDEILDDGKGNPRPAGDPNNLTGPVWSFETEKKNPQLNPALPSNVAADLGEQAVFTVEATNPLTGDDTGMTYQWYRNGAILTGQTGPQYIRTVLSGDEGSTYYCRVTLTATGRTVQSRTATILIKELLAHWSFENNVDDVTGNGYDGTHVGDPNYVAGKAGSALEFDGTTDYVDLPDGFADFTTGLTITLWAKPAEAGSWARFLDFGNGASSDNVYLSRAGAANTLHFSVYNAAAASQVEAQNALSLDVWQFLVVTMDGSGSVSLYKNGMQLATGTVSVPNVVIRTSNFIGESNWQADALFEGAMDEVKIYNYAMTADEIAEIYYQSEGEFCQEYPPWDLSGPEGEPDCVVNIYDLAGLAGTFLECGLFPECP